MSKVKTRDWAREMKMRGRFSGVWLVLALVGCGEEEAAPEGDGGAVAVPAVGDELRGNYAAIVSASYEDSLRSAQALDDQLDAFVAEPTGPNLERAKQAWLDAREPYLQTEVYRFYDGPIDNPEDGPEGLLNAWPLDENYIDYVEGAPEAGIINDAGATISGEALAGLNEAGGEKNIATGYHAIEFLLWGQDMDPNGPGARPHTDFVEGEGGTAANQGRRKQYLGAVSALLEEHLTQVKDAWAPGQENYRAEFEAASREEALRRILTGMIVLSGFETGGERLQAALDSGEQEDEHSCFSDNTHRDMVQDVVGVRNVWLGSYTRLDGSKVEGAGVRDVVMAVDAELAQEIDAQMDMSVALAEDLRVPFDQEISPANEVGRMRVQALVQSLRQQENLLERVFLKFGLTIPVVE